MGLRINIPAKYTHSSKRIKEEKIFYENRDNIV